MGCGSYLRPRPLYWKKTVLNEGGEKGVWLDAFYRAVCSYQPIIIARLSVQPIIIVVIELYTVVVHGSQSCKWDRQALSRMYEQSKLVEMHEEMSAWM